MPGDVPKHGSWLNLIELWFAVLRRQFRGPRRLLLARRLRSRVLELREQRQRTACSSLLLDLHGATAAASDSLQPNPTPSPARPSLRSSTCPTLRTNPLSAAALPPKAIDRQFKLLR